MLFSDIFPEKLRISNNMAAGNSGKTASFHIHAVRWTHLGLADARRELNCIEPTVKFGGGSIMVWRKVACISGTAHFSTGWITSPSTNQDTLNEMSVQKLDWPSQSFDLNSIEQLWAELERKLVGYITN
ncbi:hypothetical protein TNCV_4738541 [Trichonephila clavipes]|nr:hypothetical protein TNCV_4738541 [Trichonephila clavipes]